MTAKLAVLEEQMQVALDAIAEAVVFCNTDNQVQWCNAAFEQLVNLPNSSIIGHKLTKILPLRKSEKKLLKSHTPVSIANLEVAAVFATPFRPLQLAEQISTTLGWI